MRDFTYSEAKAIVSELGRFEIENYDHYGLRVISVGHEEYAIGTDGECDYAWDMALESYLEECIYPELSGNLANYFDDDKWKSHAMDDGRGHALSIYDGDEIELDAGLYAFRIN